MEFSRALSQIAEIHQQIAKGEVYRGYRPVPVAASGAIGIGAAWVQDPSLGARDPIAFVLYWTATAAIAALVGTSEILYNYVAHEDAAERRRTRQVIGQFMPAVLAAAMITASFAHLSAALVVLLPGLWAICFGIGIFASRPYLPRATGYVALLYYLAGMVLLWAARDPGGLSGWWIGATFGIGQSLAAVVLYWNLERENGRTGERGNGRTDYRRP